MRFAYIDSNGNEVPIPSVDALALRIELGAITESTQLYDAQADEWGPAHTHEIFHTLSRDAAEGDGFVAPPPVAPPPVAPLPTLDDPDPVDDAADAQTEAEAPVEETQVAEASSPDDPDDEVSEGDGSFGLTLAEAPPEDDESDEDTLDLSPAESPDSGESEGPDLPDLDLAPAPPAEEPMDLTPSAEGDDGDDAVFDFGGMDGGLELEEEFEAPAEEPMDLTPPAGADGGIDGGMGLETSMEFDTGGFDVAEDQSLNLETPMSEFTPDEPPSWMEEEEAAADGVLDFSSVSATADEAGEGEVPLRERRTPRNKPSPPKHRKQRNLAVPIVLVVLVLAVGIGGYAAWPLVSDRLSRGGEPEVPEVFLPPLADELMPVMRDASSAALAAVFENARQEWASTSPVQEPPSEWLKGIYLASAGDYSAVEEFWSGMEAFSERVRGIDLAAFDAALASELQSRSMQADQMSAVRERADSGFVAAAPDRAAVYDRFGALIDASLAFHTFLEANQDQIEYAPAAAVTTDPVLEVDPATPEIREAMENLLDDVLGSLADLQALGGADGVTAEGLRSALRVRIQEVGVR